MIHTKTVALVGGLLAFLLVFLVYEERGSSSSLPKFSDLHLSTWNYDPERDERNLGLTDEQCQKAFPNQYVEIERARDWHKARGGITPEKIALMKDEPDKAHGQVRVLIYNGNLYVVGEKQGPVDRNRYLHGLSMIYRAITSIPDPRVLPNVEFTIDRMDLPNPPGGRPDRTAWAWCRSVDDNDTWVMPDFNGWATAEWETVGGYRALREKIMTHITPFKDKVKKAIWRGQTDVGKKISDIRQNLLHQSKDKPWSDIAEIHWSDGEKVVSMDKHCDWQFAIHTEGNSWSGRLRPLKNCNSVTIIHGPLKYIAHFYPVLVPDGPHQNYVPVKNDFSDLDEKMKYYLKHQDEAERIAEESVRTFRDRYLTPAAEACYIRRMIYEWATLQTWEPQLFKTEKHSDGSLTDKMRGYSWEKFAWRPPARFDKPDPPDDYFFKSNQIDFED